MSWSYYANSFDHTAPRKGQKAFGIMTGPQALRTFALG